MTGYTTKLDQSYEHCRYFTARSRTTDEETHLSRIIKSKEVFDSVIWENHRNETIFADAFELY